jgi:hypothetical protein
MAGDIVCNQPTYRTWEWSGEMRDCRFQALALALLMLLPLCRSEGREAVSFADPISTGVRLDPAGNPVDLGSMPLGMALSPGGSELAVLPNVSPTYPPFNLKVSDQVRADAWIAELHGYMRHGRMPALEIPHLPGDHTARGPGRISDTQSVYG